MVDKTGGCGYGLCEGITEIFQSGKNNCLDVHHRSENVKRAPDVLSDAVVLYTTLEARSQRRTGNAESDMEYPTETGTLCDICISSSYDENKMNA
jgi:hypothetical protein